MIRAICSCPAALGGSLLLGAAGCGGGEPARADPSGAWRIVASAPPIGAVRPSAPEGPIRPLAIEFDGPPGFLRATVAVAGTGPDSSPRNALYDILFPIPGPARLTAWLRPAPGRPGQSRVELFTETATDASSSFVEPEVPCAGRGVDVAAEGLLAAGGELASGRETPIGRWVVRAGGDPTMVTIRVLFSRQPTGPRLKPEARPPR